MSIHHFSEEQITQRLLFDNPWWSKNEVDSFYSKMKKRLYFELFMKLVSQHDINRAVVLMGPRRVGKTVLLFHAIQKLIDSGVDPKKIIYLSVETPIYNRLPLESLFNLARKALKDESYEGYYVFFDEIQYLKDWEIHLKTLVDSFKTTRFVVSGSAAAALKLKSDESGAGRFTDFALPPLTFHEYIHLLDLEGLIIPSKKVWSGTERNFYNTFDINQLNDHFIRYINFGGYPEVIFSASMQEDAGRYIRNDIVDKVLLRDLPSLYGISDVQELNSLFTTIAYNSGGEFSLEELNQSSHVEKNTIKRYLQYLEAAFLIQIIHKIDQNAKNFKRVSHFKIYLTNPSLRSALFSPISVNDPLIGNMVETAVFSQWQHRSDTFIHYARWAKGEVDIVGLNQRQKPAFAIEIKWSNRYFEKPADLKSLVSFLKENQLKEAIVTTIDKTGRKDWQDLALEYIPASLYAYTLGRNAVEMKK
jgi:predicted AAA+ superfamily ATPase